MTLENQVVSLELAKRLKELGVRQESLFYWGYHPNTDTHSVDNFKSGMGISAFTVAELGELLPQRYRSYKYDDGQGILWTCLSENERTEDALVSMSKTEADARAKILIHLLENGIITL